MQHPLKILQGQMYVSAKFYLFDSTLRIYGEGSIWNLQKCMAWETIIFA